MALKDEGPQFSGARQGVRYRGNGGTGTYMYGTDDEPHGQMALELEKNGFQDHSLSPLLPESVEYGHTSTERQHDPTQWNGQMALPGMPKPTDPHVHRLRQANPNLNDFQFSTPDVKKVNAHDAAGNRVGMLRLGYARDDYESHEGHREVSSIGVAPDHAGKGLGEAMYDLARIRGTKIVHSDERSESGESFARRVGGPRLERRHGHGADDYLGLNPHRYKV